MSEFIWSGVFLTLAFWTVFLTAKHFLDLKKPKINYTPLADHYLKYGYAFAVTKDIDPGTKIRIPSLSKEEEEINKALEIKQHSVFDKFSDNELLNDLLITTTTSAAINSQGIAIWDQKGEKVIGVEKVNTNNSNKPMRVVKRNYDYEIMKRFFEGNI